MDKDTIILINREYMGADPSAARIKYWLGKNPNDFMRELRASKGFTSKAAMIKTVKLLRAQLGQETEANALGRALLELLTRFGYKKG